MGTLSNKPTPDYNCEQEELYAIAKIGWNSLKDHEADFFNLKPRYTATYADAQLAKVAAAKLIPTYMTRNANVHDKLLQLEKSGEECVLKWNSLERYIASAYSEMRNCIKLDCNRRANGFMLKPLTMIGRN